jgi:adenine-specific DNA-methyltransferase
MAKKVESIKHKGDKRAHIPSKEEAGYEEANEKVSSGKKVLELPKNPVVHRGQDPELFWLNKYGNDDRDNLLRVDIRSLYRHEHIAPETLIKNLYNVTETQSNQMDLFSVNELFGNALDKDEIEKVSEYYHHQDGWTNRLIQGDSHLVMASLLEREGMAGQVQTIYFDPPYGIKYGSNWQIKLNNRDVKDGNDEALAGEPEVIKAFRDTWELGIHSYLGYLRDRLLIAKELLTESGSCFVQISDENVHLVRNLMDEIFGSENFVSQIAFAKTSSFSTSNLSSTYDYIIWYSKDIEKIKVRQLLQPRIERTEGGTFNYIELPDGTTRRLTAQEVRGEVEMPKGKRFRADNIVSSGASKVTHPIIFENKEFYPSSGSHWKTTIDGMNNLVKKGRVVANGSRLEYKRYVNDFPWMPYDNVWTDTIIGTFTDKHYVVQTPILPIQRCLLMTTDPGDLVLDPTCGSGTTAFVAEQWGRRWITIDTSRIALNIAKQRLMTAVFTYYNLYDEQGGDIRQGFKYKTVPHITLKSLANDEPPATETLYDQPETDNKKLRVSGPFTVETLQNFEPVSPEELDDEVRVNEEEGAFEEVIKQHLLSAGIKNGRKDEMVVFRSVELLSHSYLHAEGFYMNGVGEKKAYFHIGPKFGTVSKTAVNEAIKECRSRGDAGWLIILGFSFESDIEGGSQTKSMGTFQVDKVRIHDDLLQEGLKKKPAKSAASFVTIGEPDIDLVDSGQWLADSNKKILCSYDIFKKLSGVDSLAKINGLSQADLSAYIIISQRRDVWINFSNAKSGREHTRKHSRRTGEELNGRISSVLGDSERFFGGIADINSFINEFELSDTEKLKTFVDELRGSRKDAEWLAEISFSKELTTAHYSLTTIKGLDIYDPIKDEVKPRNVHDIAYWMVDEDYDGSNFVVKQVFFCGGDKSEFDKWKKGLDNLAKDNTKKKVEKTLKIEIDDEAFDRLYGHISHPIEIKKKGQKIAVRIISQFGEECTKVLTT